MYFITCNYIQRLYYGVITIYHEGTSPVSGLLAFHMVFITIMSFLKAVTEEASLHFHSDSSFSEIGLGENI